MNLLLPLLLLAQPIVQRGDVITLTVSVILTPKTARTSTVAWELVPPAGWTISGSTPGSATTAAGKTLRCNPSFSSCIVYSAAPGILQSGPLATFTLTVPPTAARKKTTFSFRKISGATAGGKPVAIVLDPLTVVVQ